MFITALLTAARKSNQPRSPSNDKCIMYIYMYMMDFYSTVKKNMIMKFGRK